MFKKLLSLSLLLGLLTGCQNIPLTKTKHYSDSALSFDYPAEYDVLVEPFGEGGWSQTIHFIEDNEKEGVYAYKSAVLHVASFGSEDRSPQEQFELDKQTVEEESKANSTLNAYEGNSDFKELEIPNAEAFEFSFSCAGFCDVGPRMEFLFEVEPSYPEGPTQMLGTFSSAEYDQPIFDLFKQTVQL